MEAFVLRIVDPCAPRAYADLASLDRLGGTEATVLRIARAISGHIEVSVEQAARRTTEVFEAVRFLPMDLAKRSAGIILVINSWRAALVCRRHNPEARILVWQHVEPGKHLRSMAGDLANAGIEVVCVSNSLAAMLRRFVGAAKVTISAIANPIADDLHPDRTPRDPNLLFFASSPHKALDQVVAAFATLRTAMPGLRLEVADPGYLTWDNGAMPAGVVGLGTLPHWAVIEKMRKALCVFYPQTRFAETFGLVIAEANAVGRPALVHRGLGANDEVVSDASQCIDGTDPQMIAARIAEWRRTPPAVTLNPRFRLSAVVRDWRQLLGAVPVGIRDDRTSGISDVA